MGTLAAVKIEAKRGRAVTGDRGSYEKERSSTGEGTA